MYSEDVAFELLKARMDRPGLKVQPALERYWKQRLSGAVKELESKGIKWDSEENSLNDNILIADYTAYKIRNRDESGEMPKWLRIELRERAFKVKTDVL